MYKRTMISSKEAHEIRQKDTAWSDFCENHHGTCYWNSKTGEIMWTSDDEQKVQFWKRKV